MSSRTLILCGAFSGELEPFRALEGATVDTVGVPTRICLRESGIGNVAAAISVMRWQNEASASGTRIEEILFLGSCGIYDADAVSVPSAVFVRTFCAYELSTLSDPPRAKSLPAVSGPVTTQCGWAGQLLSQHAPEFAVNAPDAVSLVEVGSAVLQHRTGSSLPFAENLELFGMARAALECGLNFSALLGVTNVVDANGSAAWQRNYGAAARMLADLVHGILFPKK